MTGAVVCGGGKLPTVQYAICLVLRNSPGLLARELAVTLDAKRKSVSAALVRLHQHGMVRREGHRWFFVEDERKLERLSKMQDVLR